MSVGNFPWGSLSGRESRRFRLCQSKSPSDSFKLQQGPRIRHEIRLYHLSRTCGFSYPCTYQLRLIPRRTHN